MNLLAQQTSQQVHNHAWGCATDRVNWMWLIGEFRFSLLVLITYWDSWKSIIVRFLAFLLLKGKNALKIPSRLNLYINWLWLCVKHSPISAKNICTSHKHTRDKERKKGASLIFFVVVFLMCTYIKCWKEK